MRITVAERLADVHPKSVAASLREPSSDRKILAEEEWRRRIGELIARAMLLGNLTEKELSFQMGYRDSSTLSRWTSGKERPHFDKLFAVDCFYDSWVIACAQGNPRIEVETIVRVQMRRAG